MTKSLIARVRIRMLVEVTAPGSYGPEWKLGDMVEQASREANIAINNLLNKASHVEIVDTPRIVSVHTSEL